MDREIGQTCTESPETSLINSEEEGLRIPRLKIMGDTVASEDHPDCNEDRYYFSNEKGVVFVADGVSRSRDAAGAAEFAKVIVEESSFLGKSMQEVESSVENVLKTINRKIYDKALSRVKTMQTTGLLGIFWTTEEGEEKLTLGNVGDSRAYRYRGGKLEQLTLDHSLASDKLDEKEAFDRRLRLANVEDLSELDDEDKGMFRKRNKLTSVLGSRPEVNLSVNTHDVEEGDRFIFLTDGVTDNLTDDQIEAILSKYPNNKQAIEELLGYSIEISRCVDSCRSKVDDMTAVIVQVGEGKEVDRLEPSAEEKGDRYSFYNMSKHIREGGVEDYPEILKIDSEGGEVRWFITRVDPFKNELVLIRLLSPGSFEKKKMTHEEFREFIESS